MATKAPHSGARRGRLRSGLEEAFVVWLSGVRDALALHECVYFLVGSEHIRLRTLQCFMLNGVIFLGSILLFNWAVEPALGFLRYLIQDDEPRVVEFVGASFSFFYKVLWIYPIYVISFILNMMMYQEVADSAMALLRQEPTRATPLLDRILNETFRFLSNSVFILKMYLLYYLPFVGPLLYFVHSCWLASIYCFEYRWAHLRWSSAERLEYFEQHWLYFAGFGFPASFVSFLCPRFIDSGVFALFFPLMILTAARAEPKEQRLAPDCIRRLPIFAIVQAVSCNLLKRFEGKVVPSDAEKKTSAKSGRR